GRDLPFGFHGQFLLQVAVGHSRDDLGDAAHLTCQVASHEVHVVGQVLPRARDALDLRLATQLSLGADFAGHTGAFGGQRAELIDHRVDGVLQLQNFAFDVDGDLLGQVAAGDRLGDVGDIAHLAGEVAGHEVDAVGEVFPGAGHALHVGL